MSNDKVIEIIDVHKSYGTTPILKGVNLSIKQGDYISIRGKSGAGKTNLFKIMGLLQKPDYGAVNLFGKDTAPLSDDQKTQLRLSQIGLIFQFFNLLPTLTVQENIELPMALAGTKKPARIDRAMELLEYFDLARLAERYPENLSGGERQRVAIIRALVNNPKFLLADEPTSSLDDENAELLNELLGKICKEKGVAVVVTSTDLYDKLPTVCDFMLKDGVLSKM
ncbi:MAG: ABC transporter ATP-binding protein [Candidatus Bathyarchaeota archaeon]|nr:ABC transporter ATP-binding protein [Candidatus Bathyarchaeota archaeon]